jgi:hypothetical protein
LRLEGAEQFDFFRQPDFIKDPFLAGSYAVYKKETLIGEGTGKLCHIHRPKIIDSRGRWVWGDLSVAGDILFITIPEKWLADARYPVIVDPVIGTTTVGSLTPESLYLGKPCGMAYETGVNRFLVSEKVKGMCTAHVYCYDTWASIGNFSPRLFDTVQNKPGTRRSQNEETIPTKLWDYNSDRSALVWSEPHWKTAAFTVIDEIAAGAYTWFGGYGEAFWTKYDYGGEYYRNYPEMFWEQEEEEYYDEEDDEWYYTEPEGYELPDFPIDGHEKVDNFILSWYFEYESQNKNYVRTLTQGVTLTDSRKLTANYKRSAIMNGRNNTALGHSSAYHRKHTANVNSTDLLTRIKTYFCSIAENLKTTDLTGKSIGFLRQLAGTVRAVGDNSRSMGNKRDIASTAGNVDSTGRERGFFRVITMLLSSGDIIASPIEWLRSITMKLAIFDTLEHGGGSYIRGIYTMAESLTETGHEAEYYRKQIDVASSEAVSLRHLFIFIHLLTVGSVRDFIIRRFLKSNEDIVLKSAVCREIEIESRIH